MLVDDSRPTTLKQRYRSKGKSLLRVSYLRQGGISAALQTQLLEALEQALDGVLTSLRENGWRKLRKLYGLEATGLEQLAPWELVHKVGHKLKGGRMSDALEDDIACKILADFQRGRFGRVTLEPAADYAPQVGELLTRLRAEGGRPGK